MMHLVTTGDLAAVEEFDAYGIEFINMQSCCSQSIGA